jgi:hypothetical protein
MVLTQSCMGDGCSAVKQYDKTKQYLQQKRTSRSWYPIYPYNVIHIEHRNAQLRRANLCTDKIHEEINLYCILHSMHIMRQVNLNQSLFGVV